MATVTQRRRRVGFDAADKPIYRVEEGYRVRWRDPSGQRKEEVFEDENDALERKFEVEKNLRAGSYVDPALQRVTIDALWTQVLPTKPEPSRDWYGIMYLHAKPKWGNRPVNTLGHFEIQQWVLDLEVKGVGADTIRGAFKTLHACVKLAARGRAITFDPCEGVRLPTANRREMLFLQPEQIELLGDALAEEYPGEGYGELVRFTAYSGARAGEVGGLFVAKYDPLHQQVMIDNALKVSGADGPLKTSKATGRKGRHVGLPHQLCELLDAHIATQGLGPRDRMWSGQRGGPMSHNWFYGSRFKPTVKRLTDEGLLPSHWNEQKQTLYTLRFHDLRHTCVALLIRQGAQQYEVMDHLGHASIDTTIDIYGHMFPEVHERIRTHLETTWDEAVVSYVDFKERRRTA